MAAACFGTRMSESTRLVYVLKNRAHPPSYHTGLTADPEGRLQAHNAGRCRHTASGRPWLVDAIVTFADEAERSPLSAT
jgi:predicted GIY-YIG superfamily endonuclease